MTRPEIDPRKHERLRRKPPAEPANTELHTPERKRDPGIEPPQDERDDGRRAPRRGS